MLLQSAKRMLFHDALIAVLGSQLTTIHLSHYFPIFCPLVKIYRRRLRTFISRKSRSSTNPSSSSCPYRFDRKGPETPPISETCRCEKTGRICARQTTAFIGYGSNVFSWKIWNKFSISNPLNGASFLTNRLWFAETSCNFGIKCSLLKKEKFIPPKFLDNFTFEVVKCKY